MRRTSSPTRTPSRTPARSRSCSRWCRTRSPSASPQELKIPTISVGAGPHTDGQLLVWTDWAGLTTGRIPKFVKQYANVAQVLTDAATAWIADVGSGAYPDAEHSYDDE